MEYIRKEKQQMKNRETEKTDQLAILDQYDILYSMYPDLVGWIKVDGTPIDYPVMQDHTGGEYYLKHNFEGKDDNKGNPFVSADASIDPMDQNIVIFGHNVSDGSQFGDLDAYLDKKFYKKHPVITFDTIYETGQYQIVAVVKTHVKEKDHNILIHRINAGICGNKRVSLIIIFSFKIVFQIIFPACMILHHRIIDWCPVNFDPSNQIRIHTI